MNASGDFVASASPRTLFGLRVCDLGWNAALGLVESLIALRGNRTTLGFLDERTALRQMIDPAYRNQLGRRVLLPGSGRAFSILAKARHEKLAPVRFCAKTFVPALLSFLEKGHRIGIAGEDIGRVEALREHLASHAPWHDVATVALDQDISRRFDLILVDAASLAQERRIERRLASVRTGLVIMTGAGLSGFVEGKPARTLPKATVPSPKPSFA
jgi:UDP-N-acetyl-D-mannosaminuronic acid transferase (WecB/TagA/CpsF family)